MILTAFLVALFLIRILFIIFKTFIYLFIYSSELMEVLTKALKASPLKHLVSSLTFYFLLKFIYLYTNPHTMVVLLVYVYC